VKDSLDALNVDVLLCAADPPEESKRYRDKRQVPFTILSDEDHRVADRFAVPISRFHPKAWTYHDGFIQPAVFAYKAEAPIYFFVADPKVTNLFGAAGRPSAQQVLDAIRPKLSTPTTTVP
jgi:peroxiredoxin